MIGLCTDSNAQLPPKLAAHHGIAVVPLTVTIDGVEHLEGIDLDADSFYACFERGRSPEVSTAAPGPGRFAVTYERLADLGATEIVSVHVGSALSGTFNAARLAAQSSPVPVRFVDTGAASFVVGLSALAAAEALKGGGEADAAVAAAESVAERCGNVFVVGTLAFARSGGRLDPSATDGDGVSVLRLRDGQMTVVDTAGSAGAAASAMAKEVLAAGDRVRVGVGVSDASSRPVADELEHLVRESGQDAEVIRYRVGPSVGAHTGPGTAGAVYHVRR